MITNFLIFFKNVYEWEQHGVIHQPPIIVAEEGKVLPPLVPKSLYKIVSEHKDVTKVCKCLLPAWLNSWMKSNTDVFLLSNDRWLTTSVNRLRLHSFTSIAGANVFNCKLDALEGRCQLTAKQAMSKCGQNANKER